MSDEEMVGIKEAPNQYKMHKYPSEVTIPRFNQFKAPTCSFTTRATRTRSPHARRGDRDEVTGGGGVGSRQRRKSREPCKVSQGHAASKRPWAEGILTTCCCRARLCGRGPCLDRCRRRKLGRRKRQCMRLERRPLRHRRRRQRRRLPLQAPWPGRGNYTPSDRSGWETPVK